MGCRPLELESHLLVGTRRRLRAVPCSPLGIEVRVDGSGKGLVHALSVANRRGVIDHRPHERVTKAKLAPDLDEADLRRRVGRIGVDPEGPCRAPDQGRIPETLRRRDQQELPRRVRQRAELLAETLLDPVGDRSTIGGPESAGKHRRRPCARHLQQREGVSLRFRDDLVPHRVVKPSGDDGGQQDARVLVPQRCDIEPRQTRKLTILVRLARGKGDDDGFRGEAARHEAEDLQRSSIEPLRVIDDADDRQPFGGIGEQGEDGEADEEAVRGGRSPLAESSGERIPLRRRQCVDPLEE